MYQFILDDVIFPLAPDKLTIRVGNKNKTIDLISIGEINVLKKIGLRSYGFELFLPGTPYPFLNISEFKEPLFYLNKLRQLKETQQPFTFEIIRNLPDGSQLFNGSVSVSLEEYEIIEKAGEEKDFYVPLNLKEYRMPKIKTIKIETEDKKTGIATATEILEREIKQIAPSYTVAQGDTLWAIAQRELNDGSRYGEIAQLNGINDPNVIYTGQILKLPG